LKYIKLNPKPPRVLNSDGAGGDSGGGDSGAESFVELPQTLPAVTKLASSVKESDLFGFSFWFQRTKRSAQTVVAMIRRFSNRLPYHLQQFQPETGTAGLGTSLRPGCITGSHMATPAMVLDRVLLYALEYSVASRVPSNGHELV
jgi:hypothetical protein